MKKLSECNSLTQRIVSAVILAPIVLYIIWIGGVAWFILTAIACLICLWEWFRMTKSRPRKIAWRVSGIVYIVPACITLGLLNETAEYIDMSQIVFTIFAAIWAVDIFAYAFGRTIGGPKIAPKISPNKTWAGLVGGIIGAITVLSFSLTTDKAIIGGIVFAVVAQAGDFFESWVKRTCGVKDSSNIIPGHGGLLDRIDGLLAVSWLILASIAFIGLTE